jgi:hypothetical protein
MVSWQQHVLDGFFLAIFIVVIWIGPVVFGESFFVMFAVTRCYFVTNLPWDPWNMDD